MKTLKSSLLLRDFLFVVVDLLVAFLVAFLVFVLVLLGSFFGEYLLIKSDIFIVLIMLLQEWHIGLMFLIVFEPPLASALLCPKTPPSPLGGKKSQRFARGVKALIGTRQSLIRNVPKTRHMDGE